jgi:hypothetical protein
MGPGWRFGAQKWMRPAGVDKISLTPLDSRGCACEGPLSGTYPDHPPDSIRMGRFLFTPWWDMARSPGRISRTSREPGVGAGGTSRSAPAASRLGRYRGGSGPHTRKRRTQPYVPVSLLPSEQETIAPEPVSFNEARKQPACESVASSIRRGSSRLQKLFPSGRLVRIVGLFGAGAPDDDLVFLDRDLDGTVPRPVLGVDGVVLDGGVEPQSVALLAVIEGRLERV